MSPTPVEVPALNLSEAAPVRMDLRTLAAILGLAFALAGGWFTLHAGLADAQVRLASLENAKARTDAVLQEQAITNQKVADTLEHIRETTDQTARDVRELQHRK